MSGQLAALGNAPEARFTGAADGAAEALRASWYIRTAGWRARTSAADQTGPASWSRTWSLIRDRFDPPSVHPAHEIHPGQK